MRLSKNQKSVLVALHFGAQTPTELGLQFGKSPWSASAWACRALKPLLKRGLVDRTVLWRRGASKKVEYSVTDAGYDAINEDRPA